MFYRLRNALQRRQLDKVLKEVLNAPAALTDPESPFVLVSLTREKDLLMYLLAVKSFCTRLRPRQVYLLTDGDFSREAVQVLNAHVPGILLEPHVSYRDTRCPTGGCWERLLALATHAEENYVVQLDADTVTLGTPSVVSDCITAARPFTLGTTQGQKIGMVEVSAARAKSWLKDGDAHVQTLAESVLDKLKESVGMRYIRGCAAFVGIPRGRVSRDLVASRSTELQQLVGPRWSEWGTEQFMSNLLLANLDGCTVLPHPQYTTCPSIDEHSTLVAHMAGFCRFSEGQYARLAKRALADLGPAQ